MVSIDQFEGFLVLPVRKVVEILGLPVEISPLVHRLLNDEEIGKLVIFAKHPQSKKDPTTQGSSSVARSSDGDDSLLRKGLIRRVHGTIELALGVESLWALLLNAVEEDIFIPSNEWNIATEYLRNYYLNAVKEYPETYQIFPLREAFLPKYKGTLHVFRLST